MATTITSLRGRLLAYYVSNAIVLVAVIVAAFHVTWELQNIISTRVGLDRERQGIRRLHQIGLEQLCLAGELLSDPSPAALQANARLLKARQDDFGSLEQLQVSGVALGRLSELKRQHEQYESLLVELAERGPKPSLTEVRESAKQLRKEADDAFRILRAMDETVSAQLATNGVEMNRALSSHWPLLALLCCLPFVTCMTLLGSFGSRLAKGVAMLDGGFRTLGGGDFTVRLSSTGGRRPDEITSLLESFDRTSAELQRLSDIKTKFYSMAVHDLRSPLSTMQLAVFGLRDATRTGADIAVYVDVLERRLKVVLKLISSFLDSFLIDSGQVRVFRRATDVLELVEVCVADLRGQAAARGQSIQVGSQLTRPDFPLDSAKVEQILENLVGNAIKYGKAGGAIRVGLSEPGPGQLRFDIEDDGPGIETGDQAKIFDAFHRSDLTSHGTDGRGLGLAICREFVRAHGGRIWVESQAGAGSRFSFVLTEAALDAA